MRADRLLEIMLLLQARGRTTATLLAHELNVSERTIYRDLDALSAIGIPVYTQGGPGGGCGLPDHYRTLLTGVSPADIGAILMASASGPLADLGLDKRLQAAMHKLIAALPASQRQTAALARQRLHLDSAAWFRRAESVPFLAVLQEAVELERYVHLRYRGTDDLERERRLAPYGLVAKAAVWYVAGEIGDEMRVYRVSRILDATMSNTPFSRPPDFNLATFWTKWCAAYEASLPRYPVTLQIAPELAQPQLAFSTPVVEVKAVTGGEIADWPTFIVTFETLEAASTWVLGCGADVKVLAPDELRTKIASEAIRITTLYS